MKAKLRFYTDRADPNSEYIIICTHEPDQDEIGALTLADEVTIEGDFTQWPTDRFLTEE